MYQLPSLQFNQTTPASVVRIADNACIPFDPANTDFQEYQRWLAEGNEPTPADEQPTE